MPDESSGWKPWESGYIRIRPLQKNHRCAFSRPIFQRLRAFLSQPAKSTGLVLYERRSNAPVFAELRNIPDLSPHQPIGPDTGHGMPTKSKSDAYPLQREAGAWLVFGHCLTGSFSEKQIALTGQHRLSPLFTTSTSSITRYCRSDPKNMFSASVGEQIMGSPRRFSEVLSTTPLPVSFSSSTIRS
jgi:hypothetical protein